MENKGTALLDEEKIAQQARWDGVYGVVCNDREKRFSGEEIMSRYRGLWKIEEAFRINKHDLKMRPDLPLDREENQGSYFDLFCGLCPVHLCSLWS